MTIAIARCRAQLGIEAPAVLIETHLSNGLPSFNLVGLPETAVRESKERVRSALLNSGFEFPASRITVSLAPGDLPKEGTRFDLAIALSILAASGQIPAQPLVALEAVAELALSGALRPVKGIMPAARACLRAGRDLITAPGSLAEAGLVQTLRILPAVDLTQLCAHLKGIEPLSWGVPPGPPAEGFRQAEPDLVDVTGQGLARRALEVAAAGGHNLLLSGPPGTGKTMLANRLPGLLPVLDAEAAYEVAAIHSVAGTPRQEHEWLRAPFRAPHHTCSAPALVGGGSWPRPGEVSLAHRGVLFLDELPEFGRRVLDVLREPLETGRVAVARAARSTEFPARFQLVAAMNPCPCGFWGDPVNSCRCTPEMVRHYRGRISGPLLDRIDIQIEVSRDRRWLQEASGTPPESSTSVRARTLAARARQMARQGRTNHELGASELKQYAPLDKAAAAFLMRAFDHYRLNPRSYHRVVKLARTIADLADDHEIGEAAATEALALRRLEISAAMATGTGH